MNYIDSMRSMAFKAFDELFSGVTELTLTDYPDHENVGDSAIALGELEYFRIRGIRVKNIYCVGTLHKSVYSETAPVVIHGGGNFGGLYPVVEKHRYAMAQKLDFRSILIQAPQSVHFVNSTAQLNFESLLASRPNFRMAVRDTLSASKVYESMPDHIVSPDAVHLIGKIEAPEPIRNVVTLARTDGESANSRNAPNGAVDWLNDHPRTRRQTLLRWKYRYLGKVGDWLNPSPEQWKEISESRLRRGVQILSEGETIVTDRLHAMLIGLQMGRRVIAVDNNNRKLTSYADTWFGGTTPDVQFAKSFDEAEQLLSGR